MRLAFSFPIEVATVMQSSQDSPKKEKYISLGVRRLTFYFWLCGGCLAT